MSKKRPIVLAAGGTGGHIFPAQAVCAILLKKKYIPFLICDDRTTQFLHSPLREVESYQIMSSKYSGSIISKFKALTLTLFGTIFVFIKLLRLRPKMVIGFGGYPSFPTLLSATILRIPFIIHEQNAVMGRVNRLFARFTKKVLLTFPQTKFTSKKNSILCGNFVRPEIIKSKVLPKKSDKIYILIIGGSQGAQIFSEVIPTAVNLLPKSLQKKLIVRQQARPNLLDFTSAAYKKCAAKVEIKDFFLNVGELLKQADLVICRAGASTISELIELGKPSILIPYKHAMDNHQFYNAKYLVDNNAALVITEEKLTPSYLQEEIMRLLNKPQVLFNMSKCSKTLNKLNPEKRLLDLLP